MNKIFSMIKYQKELKKKFKIVNKKPIDKTNIKIAIIAQMPEIWDKLESVYKEMMSRDNISVTFIVVPEYDFNKKQINNNYGKELDFFKTVSPNYILALNENEWIDIKDYNFDYVFYQRPYDWYLPEILQSNYVSNYSKICYVPYANFQGYDFSLDLPFFHSVSYAFMYSDESCDILKNKSRKRLLSKYQSFYNAYPIYENYLTLKTQKNDGKVKIVWTPRWTTDETSGGSHFFDYKDKILELNKKFNNIEVVFRPHPLAFANYISTGLMTSEEVSDYKNKMEENGVILDENAIIEDTLRDTDILISDGSSIVTLFFLTGKPVIFCGTRKLMNDTSKQVADTLYNANSWQEIEDFLVELVNNNDYNYENRVNVRKKLFSDRDNIAKFVVDVLCR